MIKAVFFDLYHTLVRFEPPREQLHADALREFGVEVKPEVFQRPLLAADEFIYQQRVHIPLNKRSDQERMALWLQYEGVVLKEAGIEANESLILGLLGKIRQVKSKLVVFDDVVPALSELKVRQLSLGLISNIERDITSLLDEVGLSDWFQVVVTSLETGLTKPQPGIFQFALKRAGVQPSEAIYVGDQYQVDVGGANSVGMKGVLLDRGGCFAEVTASPRIQSLSQIVNWL